MGLRVGFAGTPAFAARALVAILEAGFSVPLVLTRPDKPKGRGHKVEVSAVKSEALARGLQVLQPASLRVPELLDEVLATPLDVLVVAAYGLILPRGVLEWPRHGCLNIHASLLPRWRGAAPIQRAIEAGDRATGVTIMQMDEGLDTGPMITARELVVHPRETYGSLHDRLADVGASAIVDVLATLERDGALRASPQPATGAVYAEKIGPGDSRIDWSEPARAVDRRIRALEPEPGAHSFLAGERIKIRRALPVDAAGNASPGSVVRASAEGFDVACGEGALRIVELQPAGGRRMPAAAFLAGRPEAYGMRFADAPER